MMKNNHGRSVLILTQSEHGMLKQWKSCSTRIVKAGPDDSSNRMMSLAGSGLKMKEEHLNI